LALKEAGKLQEVDSVVRLYSGTELANTKQPARNARMLVRDFIHNSLYNPFYGYFSKQAVVFSPPEPFSFHELKDNNAFMHQLSNLYDNYERQNQGQQIWHTPTEIFQPHYGNAVAKCLVDKFKQVAHRSENLVVYEVGAGNGTLMKNVLDYVEQNEPQIYRKMTYKIIEISPKLAREQAKRIGNHPATIINKSIFEWTELEPENCFFIAMEVLV
jgi:SAM-dependent MidA family methyltransferase